MRTLLEVLNLSTDYLRQKNIQNSRRQAEMLLCDALKMERMELYLEFDRPLTDEELELCRSWLKRRGQGEPLQYIAGRVDFFDCELFVSPDGLIPRHETEILVDKIVKELKKISLVDKVLWDVCCGPGSIGIAIKKKLPELTVCLSDISNKVLSLAKKNAKHNHVEVEFLEGDLLQPFLNRKADFIVCNPPYITEKEYITLDVEVKDFEPKQALVSGETGLEFYARLAQDLPAFLNPGGKVWFEMGTGQGEAIKQLFQATYWKGHLVELDWSKHERFFSLEIE